uniref:GST C-terminal domain-containing protein n=1 Tax=Mucochytrium quahogii TaxID=96639 RepID=A0A7S2WGA5_9STRA|mmetsp:Transcript_19344/g.32430  ORF Transcript_19344/g.32430 Transcript_19344/m.32430 type:complete len:919 (-) Transcript_19344:43-2799(-)|eukprot:CAMPEP_0203748272 /NCGR_PEP_ID=MMETSP0098-20131031/3201_1 /ASSEMBLY_ACC=CAM_ASM_000208 /TAXON_ID=96639 /ORGANISM=" , Strain NY0313808BC1" /LENGTH=918 /DNA_ID=CAMNT_0050636965 /DNA_START=393 /DNA_END=3149 /DNA_ORIENTATION=+
MDLIKSLHEKAEQAGAAVRELKEKGSDFSGPLEALKSIKKELSDAALAYLPTQEKVIEDLRASGAADSAIEKAEAILKDLKSKLVEDKKAKKKREQEEKKRKAAAAAAAGGDKQDQPKKKDGPSKKELNKMKRKAGKAKGAQAEASDAPQAANTPVAVTEKAAVAAGPAVDLEYPLVSRIVSQITKLKDNSGLRGDFTIARHLARLSNQLYGQEAKEDNVLAAGKVDQWMEFSMTNFHHMSSAETLKMADEHLKFRTFFAGHALSLADIAMWCGLVRATGGNADSVFSESYTHLNRWGTMVKSIPGFSMVNGMYNKHLAAQTKAAAAPVAAKKAGKTAAKGVDDRNVDKYKLPGLKDAVVGKVVTRFPPEPSGHLHIGHAKALFLNKYYAERYKGEMLIRFDDTNPEKEKVEFEEGIIEDLKTLGVCVDKISYTSDHFDTIIKYAARLIKQGDAYMDDTPQEKMSEERRAGIESVHRDSESNGNMFKFFCLVFGLADAEAKAKTYGVKLDPKLVAEGKKLGGDYAHWCLRAKVDMASKNKALCDPVIFRGNSLPHARTKNTYKAYPCYDLACPIVDSIEGVTHAMRDILYRDRAPLYQWFFPKLGLRPVAIQDFSRMNFIYTLMSKRKLKWFVESGRVPGWDDPRFPTIKGVLRRGMQIDALFDFMVAQGASKNIIDMEWDKFWALNKKIIDPVAPRYMAVSKQNSVEVKIKNADGSDFKECVKTIPLHPKDVTGEKFGMKSLFQGPVVLVEGEDLESDGNSVEQVVAGEDILLVNWGVQKVTKVEKDASGKVSGLEVQFVPGGDVKLPKRKIHWVAKSVHNTNIVMHEFDYLITKPKFDEGDKFEDFINENSEATTELIGEPGLRHAKFNTYLQLVRRGYFRVDAADLNNGQPISLFMIPDGKVKSMSTLSTKLAHR